ncbi:MAG: FecR domain-containing protein [Pseudomonadota bacterium]
MADQDDLDPEEFKRAIEAADIHQRLEDDPNDQQAQRDRDAFLARGEAERDTYARLLKGVGLVSKALGRKPKSPPRVSILLAVILGAFLYMMFEPISVYLRADHITGIEIMTVDLASGDTITLDASSAIIDQTNDIRRQITLLKGAAYFQVEQRAKPFRVRIDDIVVEVVGTEFEVTRFEDQLVISVAEGTVDVLVDNAPVRLEAGDRLRYRDGLEPVTDELPISDMATWRDGLIVTDGMSFQEVVEILNRRIPGPVIILDNDLANEEFDGRLDLRNPLGALEALAIGSGATVTSASPVVTIVRKN